MAPQLEILHSHLPTVAIVGRPNVGKSTLFNRIVGRRKAVVLDTAGMTRDRNFEIAEWGGREFRLVDTGGYETNPRDSIYEQMRVQSLIAMHEAAVVIFLVDLEEPNNPVDRDVADLLRRATKPALLAVNKCDAPHRIPDSYAFYEMGHDEVFPISALNGSGVGDLLDRVLEHLPAGEKARGNRRDEGGIRIAVIGRPNVGKSSLVNALLGRERVIVSDIPGTTRDTIDTTFRIKPDPESEGEGEERVYTLIDTAGLRRRGKIEPGMEKLSALAAQTSLKRCDVALCMIDASEGIAEQDKHVAGFAFEAFRACVLIVNKWDLPEKGNATAGEFAKNLRDEMPFLQHVPIMLVSAKTGQRVHRILETVDRVYTEFTKEIGTPELNRWLKEVTIRLSPPWRGGKQLRIKYVTQVGTRPPTFAFFVNNPDMIHFSYERYLVNQLREAYGFEGCPLRLVFKRKSRKEGEEPQAERRPRPRRDRP
ncbi:ribosome biogenesis GTPase Der [bacterium]|nr:ribosome biogenesis GTPase Der [bacterium]